MLGKRALTFSKHWKSGRHTCYRVHSGLRALAVRRILRGMESNAPQSNLESRYELQQLLGSGGAGKVYKAWDKSLRRYVAIKRFGSEFGPATTSDEQAWREAMTLASIQHPNILTVFDFGMDALGPYVIMEFLEGETLDKVVKRAPLHIKDFRELAKQTLEALIAAHQIGLIHRDLKPQNIMVLQLASGATQYKILDFGLAKIVQEPREQTMVGNTIMGSILYIAPEQLSRKPVDARSDLYSMGCVYYYALTGHNAFEGESVTEIIAAHVRHRVVPLPKRRAEIPQPLADWVMKFIQLQPEHRWQSAAEALAALNKLPSAKTILIKSGPIPVPSETTAPAAKPPTAPVPAAETQSKWTASRISAIVGSVVLGVLLVAMAIQHSGGSKSAKPAVAAKPLPTKPAQPAKAPIVTAKPSPSAPAATPTQAAKAEMQTSVQPSSAEPLKKPADAKMPAASQPSAPGQGDIDLTITAPVIWAHEMDKLKTFIGKEAAVRGRASDIRSKGDELWIGFEGQDINRLVVIFPLDKAKREDVLKYARAHRNQMVCLQGVVEQRDQQWIIRAKDVRQLDALPPL